MRKLVLFVTVLSVFFLNACVSDSDWGKVTVPANQALVFSTPENSLDNYEKHIFINTKDGELFLTNRNLTWRICFLKAAFPDRDIVVEYVKSRENGNSKLDPRFVMIQE